MKTPINTINFNIEYSEKYTIIVIRVIGETKYETSDQYDTNEFDEYCVLYSIVDMLKAISPTDTVLDFICDSEDTKELIQQVLEINKTAADSLWRYQNELYEDFEDWVILNTLLKTNTIITRVLETN
jgi:hypothetical protein